jgi:tRNA pseudouridine32 synthase/23S rRNA pseudouridine746 synthase
MRPPADRPGGNDPSPRPPSRDGVGASCIALPPGPWPTVLAFLAHRFDRVPPSEWRLRMDTGCVVDGDGVPVPHDAPHRPHHKLYYYRSVPAEPRIPFDEAVLHQDEHLVVADKPHFLPVTPGGRYVQETLLVRLRRRLGIESLSPIHRIDRETAGLVAFSVRPGDRDRYHALFRDRAVTKHYEAIAPWRPGLVFPMQRRSRLEDRHDSFMQSHEVTGPANAETDIEVLDVQGVFARYGLHPLTGRRHQLRVHMAALGCPIVGDRIYPVLQPDQAEGAVPDHSDPLRLLARRLAFTCPVTGRAHVFESQRTLAF